MHPVFVVFNNLVHENYLNLSKAIKDYYLNYYIMLLIPRRLNSISQSLDFAHPKHSGIHGGGTSGEESPRCFLYSVAIGLLGDH